MLRVALKDLMARKRRLVTTSIAVVLGIAFLTGTQLLSATLSDSIKSLVGDVYEGVDAVVRSPRTTETPFGQPIRTPVPAATVEQTGVHEFDASKDGRYLLWQRAQGRLNLPVRAEWPLLGITAFGVIVGFPLFLALALRHVPSTHGAVVTALLPLSTAVLGALWFRQRPSGGFWACAVLGSGLVLAYMTGLLPFTVWMCAGYFEDIPLEIEEARATLARLDAPTGEGQLRLTLIAPSGVERSTAGDFRGLLEADFSRLILDVMRRTDNVTVILDCCDGENMTDLRALQRAPELQRAFEELLRQTAIERFAEVGEHHETPCVRPRGPGFVLLSASAAGIMSAHAAIT